MKLVEHGRTVGWLDAVELSTQPRTSEDLVSRARPVCHCSPERLGEKGLRNAQR